MGVSSECNDKRQLRIRMPVSVMSFSTLSDGEEVKSTETRIFMTIMATKIKIRTERSLEVKSSTKEQAKQGEFNSSSLVAKDKPQKIRIFVLMEGPISGVKKFRAKLWRHEFKESQPVLVATQILSGCAIW